jgi:very-short-patch-repair endonuclease
MKRFTQTTITNSRYLRNEMTDVEQLLWQRIRNKQLHNSRFRRQHPIDHYIVDFVCLEKNLIIECDGSQHANQKKYDSIRSLHLSKRGFVILRFWNNQVINEMAAVLEIIFRKLE